MNWRDRARLKFIEQASAEGGPVAGSWIRGLTRGGDAVLARQVMGRQAGRVFHNLRDDDESLGGHIALIEPKKVQRRPGEALAKAKARWVSTALKEAKARWTASIPHIDIGCAAAEKEQS